MISITSREISPEAVINSVRSDSSGCVVTYVGLIRGASHGKQVLSVEYQDADGRAEERLQRIAAEVQALFPVNGLAFCHRTGRLEVGDINLVIAVAAAHREEGFAACTHAIDLFKKGIPTRKIETYTDGETRVDEV